MPTDITSALALLKEGGALVLLAMLLFRWTPQLVETLNRTARILSRIEEKLNIKDTDIVVKPDGR